MAQFLLTWSGVGVSIHNVSLQRLSLRRLRGLVACLCAILFGFYVPAFGQQSITSDGYTYQQDFNSLAATGSSNAWLDNITLPGWFAANAGGTSLPVGTTSASINTYRANNGSSSSVGLFSFGTVGSSERALGAANSNDNGDIVYGVLFENNCGVGMNSATLTLRAEQWRRTQTSTPGHQRIKVSYAIANPFALSTDNLFEESQFIEIPEAYLLTLDTTTQQPHAALDGNAAGLNASVTVSFPISLPPGWQLFLRFFDENTSGVDMAVAIDDLSITFSQSTQSYVTATSGYDFFAYCDQGVIKDIPAFGNYVIPSDNDRLAWEEVLNAFFAGDWSQVDAAAFGYELASLTDRNSKNFYVLRKASTSGYYWGTYIKAVNPSNPVLVIQAPHPHNDQQTGRQSAAIFQMSGATALMIAGMGRCASDVFTGCQGSTAACGADQPFRMSDVPHTPTSIFQVATIALAQLEPATVFVQLHGFSWEQGDPDFYISCGTLNGIKKSVPDYPVLLRENIQNINPDWNIIITHVDNDETLGARDNVQGRYLNLYPEQDICTGAVDAQTVTNRFLHIEQKEEFRSNVLTYGPMAAALANAIQASPYIRAIQISNLDDPYVQNFDLLSSDAGTHTWGNNLHVPGWYAVQSETGLFSRYRVDDGSSASGGLYSYGSATSNDRALGTLNTNAIGHAAVAVLFRNNSGATIRSMQLTYRGEQWRGEVNAAQQIQVGYTIGTTINLSAEGILNNTLFTSISGGNMTTINDGVAGPMNGNENTAAVSDLPLPLVLNDGQELLIRFYDANATGNDRALAIDDFEISFSTVPLLIDWRSFEVNTKQGLPELKWVVEKEELCDYYQILRSSDGANFEQIAVVTRQDNEGKYQFVDRHPLKMKVSYYQIVQYDLNGDKTLSEVRPFWGNSKATCNVFLDKGILNVQSEEPLRGVLVFDFLGRTLCDEPEIQVNDIPFHYQLSCPSFGLQPVVVKLLFAAGPQVVRIIGK